MPLECSFDPERHEYRTPGGVVLPGITSRGRAAGLLFEFEGNDFLDMEKGTRIHEAVQLAIEGDLDEEHFRHHWLDDWGYVQAALTAIEREGLEPCKTADGKPTVEYAVGNPDLGYATRVDLLCQYRGKKTAVNWKTSEKVYRWYAWQSAFEALLFTPEPIYRLGVHLRADGDYRLQHYTNRTDFTVAKAALTIAAAKNGGQPK